VIIAYLITLEQFGLRPDCSD